MYHGADRRQSERREVEYRVELLSPPLGTGQVQDVSSGGALIVLSSLPSQGETVVLEWPLESDSKVKLTAEVRWTMEGDGVKSVSAIGVKWLTVEATAPGPLRRLLQEVLEVNGGFAQKVDGRLLFSFPALLQRDGQDIERTHASPGGDAPPQNDVPPPPAPAGERALDDAPTVGFSGHVSLPAKIKVGGSSIRGTVVTLAERRVVVETTDALPSHSDRVELRVSIPSSEGVLPLKIYGQVSRTRAASPGRNPSFWVLVTKVDESGRTGLFRQYVEYIS